MSAKAEAKGQAKRAAIYSRISEDRHGDELGVKRQLGDARKLCRERGFTIAAVYQDNDVSAYNGHTRPEYERMLDDVRAGRIDVIVSWHPDRLYRHPRDLERFVEVVEQSGAQVATVTAGELDLSTASGRMVARMLGAAARYEGEHKAERQRRKHLELAESGRPGGGGDRPFGFEDDRITIRPTEAKVIRAGVRHILAGGSLRSLVAKWNAEGIKTTRGNPWSPQVLRTILLRGRIAGLREHRGVVVGPAVWKPIITPAEHEAVVAVLTNPNRTTNAGQRARTYLLTGGLARCGRCGAAMVARPNDRGARRYACTKDAGGCNGMFMVAEPFEDYVRDLVIEALDGEALERALASTTEDTTDVEMELSAIHAKLDESAAAYADGVLTLEAYTAATRKLEKHRDDLRRITAATTTSRTIGDLPTGREALSAWWDTADLLQRREVVAAVLDHVRVGPAVPGRNTFDPTRVDPRWKV